MSFALRVVVLVVAAVLAPPLSAQLVVTPSNLQGWQLTASTPTLQPPPAVYLAPGFETPPLGSGSAHMAVGADGNLAAQLRHPGFAGTLLSNITALSYSTYVEVEGSGGQAPYLILNIDTNGDTTVDDQLFFEPVYQTGAYAGDPVPNQGALLVDTWQTWDALAGGWWSLNAMTFGPPLVTLASYAAANPTARIINTSTGLGGVRIVTGFGAGAWDNFLGAADNFTIGVSGTSTTYDFEAAATALVTVTTASPDGWTFEVDDEAPPGTSATVTIVSGPGTPPLGDGSLQLSVGADGNDAAQARNNLYDGQLLRDLSQLTYSTYVQNPGSGGQAPYIMLNVDYDGNGTTDDILFFEPVYQTAAFCSALVQPAIVVGTWQTWNAASGCWWSLNGTGGATPGAGVKPLSAILDAEPDARLATGTTGSLRVVAGYGAGAWDNFVGNVDAVQVAFTGTPTLYDFEPIPVITIGDVTQFEGTGGTTNFVFNLTLSEAVSQTVTVQYTTADGTATAADGDYTPVTVPATATFTPGSTASTITIVVNADTKFELDETFFVNLQNPQFATLAADTQGQGTIRNDDVQPTITVTPDPLNQSEASTNFVFNVTLSNPTFQTVTVNFTTTPGTATEGTDYTDNTGTVTFVPNDTAETITVVVANDTIDEPNETFFVDFTAPVNATMPDPQAQGVIVDDDAAPVININDVAQAESAGTFVFTVTLSNPSSSTVTVNFTTNPGTATEGTDYTDATGTLTFVPGDVSETISVTIVNDAVTEPDETFTVDLSVPVNATIGDGQGLGTIQNDEGLPTINITDVTQAENLTSFVFTVTLSNASASTVTVNFTTNPGTATEGTDYTDATGTVTFVPGDVSETVTVTVIDDAIFEPSETFTVALSAPVNAAIADGQGLGTIVENDAQPSISISDVTQNEGNTGTSSFIFTVTLSGPSATPVTVNFTTNPGTATEGVDYTDATGTVTFAPGDVSETITVAVIGDTAFEANETFTVDLSVPAGASILDNQGLGTIVNDDGPIADLSIAKTGPPSVPRGQNMTYTITVSNAGPQTASNVVVTDVLPAGSTFVSATPSQGSCSGTSTVTCTLGAIASGGTATISLVIQPPTSGQFTNTATVTNTPESDPTPANNAGTTTAFIHSNDIPTLSEWALLALLMGLLGLAVVKLR